MDRAIDSASAKKCGVRRVHNRIDIKFSDVPSGNIDLAFGILHGWSSLQMTRHE
jgi:hypothetical protein